MGGLTPSHFKVIMTITLQSVVARELLPTEVDENFRDLAVRTGAGWKDLISSFDEIGVPAEFIPIHQPFGPSGLRRELVFNVNDYAFVEPFHINHDVKIGGKCYVHIHWSTSGTDVQPVKWEFQVSRAKGHNQEYFGGETSYFVTQTPVAGAWRHMIAEVSSGDALTLTEPDELILVTVRRVTNGGVDNAAQVFGLTVDCHYEADRDTTPNKSPSFY
jgi:hypothetical protein